MTRQAEEGSASLGALSAGILILFIALIGMLVVRVQAEKLSVQGVADMAALAGGGNAAASVWTPREEQACQSAEKVAQANATRITFCRVEGGDIYVEVTTSGHIWGIPVQVTAHARAGSATR